MRAQGWALAPGSVVDFATLVAASAPPEVWAAAYLDE